jgi:hypothetical protein
MPAPQSPYRDSGEWLRGNLHSHTTVSDGTRPAEEVIADYEQRGYDYLAISDHDQFVDPRSYQDRTKLILLPAVEVTARGPHILHIGATEPVEPSENRQEVVDRIAAQNGFSVLNHPNWQSHYNHCPQELMESLVGYAGIEIYNGVIERLEGVPLATDRWDRLLSQGRRVWGFGTDDAHAPQDVALAWSVVQVDDRSVESIIEALRAGRFYASTGVTITDITTTDSDITVVTENARRIRLISDLGVIQKTKEALSATFRVPEDLVNRSNASYARIECYGDGGRMAWTQPFFLS